MTLIHRRGLSSVLGELESRGLHDFEEICRSSR